MSDLAAHEPEKRIHIDRQPYIVHKNEITGTELRNLPTPPIAESFDLWLEEHGDVEDQPVPTDETLHLKEDMHFYSSPNNINPGGC